MMYTFSIFFVTVFIVNCEFVQGSPQRKACCYALTANCLSCAAGVSQKEYCQDFPNTLGCQNKLGQDEGSSFNQPQLDQNYIVEPNPAIIIARKKRSSITCKIHESVCKYWCRIAGHSSGSCDIQGECLCSEEDLEKYICDPNEEGPGNKTQHTLCAGWCQLKGKQSGDCDTKAKECVCTGAELGAKHAKCIDDTVCSMWCQIKERKATGKCEGEHNWDCVCKSAPKDKDNEVEWSNYNLCKLIMNHQSIKYKNENIHYACFAFWTKVLPPSQ